MERWYAVYTKPGCADSSASLLATAGIETFAPKIRLKKYRRGRYLMITEDLFPCYVFARFDAGKLGHLVTYTRGVRYVVGKDQPIEVPQELIDAIRQRLVQGVVCPPAESLKRGDEVLIHEGPFQELYAVFERELPGKERVVLLLRALNCHLEIERSSVRKVSKGRKA